MHNKHNWQYKGLTKWILCNESKQLTIRDIISGRIGEFYNNGEVKFVRTDLPTGKTSEILFSNGNYNGVEIRPGGGECSHGITYSFWIKTILANDNITIYDNNAGFGQKRIYILLNLASANNIFLAIQPYIGINFPSTVSLKDGKWHNVIVSISPFDGQPAAINVYTDGNFAGSSNGTELSSWTSNFDSFLGGANTTDGIYMYDFRVYNYPWRPGQVAKYYHSISERNALLTPERIFNYVDTIDTITNSVPLSINGPLPLESGMPWHTLNTEPYNNGADVYISGSPGMYNDSTTLYIKNSIDYSAGIDVYISGREVYESSSIPMYINGPTGSGLSFHIHGYDLFSSSTNLYMFGSYIDSTGIPSYMYGYDTRASGTSLFIKGHIPLSSGITTYMYGHGVDTGGINLVCQAAGNPISKGTNIFMWASTSGTYGIYNSTPMTVYNTVTTDPRNGINFSITAPNGDYSEGINLVVGNVENRLNLGTTLYIDGPEGIITSGLSMYINTPVGTTGTVPFDGGMNMFINRLVDSYGASAPIYLKAPEGYNSYTPMYINGANIITNNTPMYIEGSGVPTSNSSTTSFFTRGGE